MAVNVYSKESLWSPVSEQTKNSFCHFYFIVFCCWNLGQITRAFNHTINNRVAFLSFLAQYQVKNKSGGYGWSENPIYHSEKKLQEGETFVRSRVHISAFVISILIQLAVPRREWLGANKACVIQLRVMPLNWTSTRLQRTVLIDIITCLTSLWQRIHRNSSGDETKHLKKAKVFISIITFHCALHNSYGYWL